MKVDDYNCTTIGCNHIKYIVKPYDSCKYIAIFDTKEEAMAKAEELNDTYYQHKVWNVEELEMV